MPPTVDALEVQRSTRRSPGFSGRTRQLVARDRGGERVDVGVAAGGGKADQVAQQRRVRTLAAVVRGDARDSEQRAHVSRRKLEVHGRNSGGDGDRVTRGLQPGIHTWHAIAVSKAPPYSVAQVEATRLPEGSAERDAVAVEEPLGIRVNGEPDAVTCTPLSRRPA